jgi:hypothetical protein
VGEKSKKKSSHKEHKEHKDTTENPISRFQANLILPFYPKQISTTFNRT